MVIMRRFMGMLPMFLMLTLVLTGCGTGPLSIRVAQGDKVSYHMVINVDMSVKSVQSPPEVMEDVENAMSGNASMEYDASITFEELKDGLATVTYQIDKFKGSVNMAGSKQSLDGLLNGEKVTVNVNAKTGEVINVEGLTKLSKGDSIGFSEQDLKDALRHSFAQLPQTGRAKPGDQWEYDVAVPTSIQGAKADGKLKGRTKYEGNTKRDGVQVAKLIETVEGPLNVNMSNAGAAMEMKAQVTGANSAYVDLKNGLPLSGDAVVTMDVALTLGNPQTAEKIVIDMQVKTVMKLTKK